MSESDSPRASAFARKYLVVVVLAAGVVVPGLVQFAVREAGYPQAATAAWVVGYAGVVALVWWRWVRPIDLSGPNG